ncbi:MAG: DNA polymerase III subunit delta [Pseudomonadota bacterium]
MKISPVVFVVGAQPLQQKLFVEEVRKNLFPNGSGGLNDDTFDAKEKNLVEILDLANTFPMLAPKRLVVVTLADDPKEADETRWISYVENPSPNTVLVGLAAKLDKRKRLFKALDKIDAIVTLPDPKAREIPVWVEQLARHHAVTFTPRAKLLLAEAVGTDLTLLDQEIAKLALYAHPATTIDEKMVAELVLETAEANIFEFTDQVVERRTGEALHTMDRLIATGTPPLVLLTMLTRHLRILWKANHHTKSRTNRNELPAILGVPPFAVSRYMDQARSFQTPTLKQALSELGNLDRDLKSSGLPAKLLMERSLRTITAI